MKKRVFSILIVVIALLATSTSVLAVPPPPDKLDCVKIQDGVITYSIGHYLKGQSIGVGYDIFGYNYQAHLFNGSYANVYLGRDGYPPYNGDDDAYLVEYPDVETKWYWPYRTTELLMKWDQDWLANVDCNGDGKLDRHMDTPSYIGSGAWETNHMWDSYEQDGQTCNWDYFTKIVAVPSDASLVDGVWFAADDTEIGPEIWGQFATIQEVSNDPCGGEHGIRYNSESPTGFGFYTP